MHDRPVGGESSVHRSYGLVRVIGLRAYVTTALEVAGIGAISTGFWLILPGLGLIAAGCGLILIGWREA